MRQGHTHAYLNFTQSSPSPFFLLVAIEEASGVSSSVADAPRRKLNEYRSREVAEELCLMDSELLRKIEPPEPQNGAWMKKDKVCCMVCV